MQYRTKCLSVGVTLTLYSLMIHGWTIWDEMDAHFVSLDQFFHQPRRFQSIRIKTGPLLSYQVAQNKNGQSLLVRVDGFSEKGSSINLENDKNGLTVQSNTGNSLIVSRSKDGVEFTLETDNTTERKSETSYYKSSSATQSIERMKLSGEVDFENATPLKHNKETKSIEFSIPLRNVVADKQPNRAEEDIEIIPFKTSLIK